jgi:hypothetical protein
MMMMFNGVVWIFAESADRIFRQSPGEYAEIVWRRFGRLRRLSVSGAVNCQNRISMAMSHNWDIISDQNAVFERNIAKTS